MAKRKPLYLFRGTFNYSHEIVVKYTYAPTWAAAKTRMLRRIANEHQVSYQAVFAMFDGRKDNFRLEIEK